MRTSKRHITYLLMHAAPFAACVLGARLAFLSHGTSRNDTHTEDVAPPRKDKSAVFFVNSPEPVRLISQPHYGGKATNLVIQNEAAYTVTVTIEVSDSDGRIRGASSLHTQIVPARQTAPALTLSANVDGKWTRWPSRFWWVPGSNIAHHNDSVVYRLPYTLGQTFTVSQGFNGSYSHYGCDQYAIDFVMPTGTFIHAARSGVVVDVQTHFTEADRKSNYILIEHEDGTLGQYAHLQTDGARVQVGQRVETGELIGFSGNTGTYGPHLHFMVFTAVDGKSHRSVPVRFHMSNGTGVFLQQGKAYTAL